MSTAFTAPIETGITFQAFVLRCARAMGPMILLRDESLDTPLPDKFQPSDFYARQHGAAKANLSRTVKLSDDECANFAKETYRAAREAFEDRRAKAAAEDARYTAMFNMVMAWTPPTKDHEPLRDFMLSQIRESMNGDVYGCMPQELTGDEWREQRIKTLTREVAYYAEEAAKENSRTEWRNAWLSALRQSLYP